MKAISFFIALTAIFGLPSLSLAGTCPCDGILRYSTSDSVTVSGLAGAEAGYGIGCPAFGFPPETDSAFDSNSETLDTCGGAATLLLMGVVAEINVSAPPLSLHAKSTPKVNYQVLAQDGGISAGFVAQSGLVASASGGDCSLDICGLSYAGCDGTGHATVKFTVVKRGRLHVHQAIAMLTSAATGSVAGSWSITGFAGSGELELTATGDDSSETYYTICPGNYTFHASFSWSGDASASTGCDPTGPVNTAVEFGYDVALTFDEFCSPCEECVGDLDCNGAVNGTDLAILLGQWGSNPGSAADLDCNQVVNGLDQALLLGNWGPCR